MQRSPSALIESISALRISDPDESDDDDDKAAAPRRVVPHNGEPLLEAPAVRALLADTAASIDEIRRAIFVAEEQRHTGRFLPPAADAAVEAAQPSELDRALMGLDGQLGSVSSAMHTLEASIDVLEAACTPKLGNGNGVDGEMAAWAAGRSRRGSSGSQASLSSFASFDEAVRSRNGGGGATGTAALRREFGELSADWAKVQQEAETLKRELGEDKYVVVFQSVSGQASGMMDSLDKALAVCANFITSATTLRAEAADYEDEREERNARLADLRARRHTFEVKRGHYGPACEQVFSVLERGLRDRATSNGSVLRSFMELKARWRALREAMSRMEKEMRRVEAQLLNSGHAAAESSPASSSISAASLGAGSSSSGTPTRPRVGPKSSMRDLHSSPGMPARRSPSAGNLVGIAASGIAPPKPPKSARRLSSIDADAPRSIPARTSSAAYAQTQTPGSSSLVSPPASRLRKAPSSSTMRTQEQAGRFGAVPPPHLADRPAWKGSSKVQDEVEVNERSVHVSASGRTTPGSSHYSPSRRIRSQQDPPVPPSSYRPPGLFAAPPSARSKTPQPQPTWSRGASEPPPDLDFKAHRRAAPSVGDSSIEDVGNVSLDSFTSRPARPSSAAGMYYRPPSAAGTVTDERGNKRNSLIPRLAMQQSSESATGSRPSSAMSHASASAFASSPRGHYAGPSRSTMQTPEPTIAARVQRLSMFAKPSRGTPSTSSPATKRSSRPPPARYNVGGTPSVTSPLNISKSSGRTTPLSAAALAAVPHAGPTARSVSGASSVSNFRATRSGGRATPTFSDTGGSSVGGYSAWNGGASRGGALEQYRPNPADALDVEVAYIINALGVGLERVSEPLPRGFKAEPRPGQEVQAQYSIGGAKPIMCKLLELHRPAGSAGARSGTKVRKVLARVGGGWIDLEQHVLSRLGAV